MEIFAPKTSIAGFFDAPPMQKTALQAIMRGRLLTQAHLDRFAQLGITALNLSEPWSTQIDHVVFDGEYFEFVNDPHSHGERAVTFGVISDDGLIDAVAWHPTTDRLGMWCGHGFALSEYLIGDHLNNAQSGLSVYRSPIGWLQANCRGIVIVRKSYAYQVLKDVSILIAEDERHEIELREMFPNGSRVPRIVVRAPLEIAA